MKYSFASILSLFLFCLKACAQTNNDVPLKGYEGFTWAINPGPRPSELAMFRVDVDSSGKMFQIERLVGGIFVHCPNTWADVNGCINDMLWFISAYRQDHNIDQPIWTTIYATNTSTHWQFQEVRDQQEKYQRQCNAAKAFNRTNLNPGIALAVEIPNLYFDHKLTANDIELGYRSDGSVVWRTPPEAVK